MGTGVTCVRAFRIILLEPDYLKRTEAQGIFRICRIGQRNPMTYSYRMICPGSKVEQTIISRQNMRGNFRDLSFAEKNRETPDDNDEIETIEN